MTVFTFSFSRFVEKLTLPQQIVLPYLTIGTLYILFSDRVVRFMFSNINTVTEIQTYKGLAFVMVTGGILYFLSKSYVGEIKDSYKASAYRDELYRALIENSGDLTMLTNREGEIKFTGPNIYKLLGYTSAEFLCLNIFQLVAPEHAENLRLFNDEVFANPGKLYTFEARVHCKNGEYIWMEATVVNHLNNPIIQGIVTNARVTNERKIAEARISQSERLFKSAFEQVATGMANLSLTGEWILVNNQLCNMCGYSREELQSMYFLDIIPATGKRKAEQDLGNILAGMKVPYCIQKRIERKDGTLLWVDQMMTLITDEDNAPLYVAVVMKDIDIAKKTEAELNYKNKELDTFIYRSSHDLRGPITTLLGLTDIAKLETDDEKMEEYFGNCNLVARKMEKTLDDLMAVTQIKQIKTTTGLVVPRDLINNVLASKTTAERIAESIVTVETDDTLAYHSDEQILILILKQLIDNALIFKNGNRAHQVLVHITGSNERINIEVLDNGIGISEDEQPLVFDLHYRGKNALGGGSGIGLYLVKAAVEKLGGNIHLNSAAGIGTQVTVSLPNKSA